MIGLKSPAELSRELKGRWGLRAQYDFQLRIGMGKLTHGIEEFRSCRVFTRFYLGIS
jgi:hypothetical protein